MWAATPTRALAWPARRQALTPAIATNMDGHARAVVPRLEVVQVQRTHGGPAVFSVFGVQHPSELFVSIQVVVTRYKSCHGLPADWEHVGAHPPVFARVFPVHEKVYVRAFQGPQSMSIARQHDAKIAVPSAT